MLEALSIRHAADCRDPEDFLSCTAGHPFDAGNPYKVMILFRGGRGRGTSSLEGIRRGSTWDLSGRHFKTPL